MAACDLAEKRLRGRAARRPQADVGRYARGALARSLRAGADRAQDALCVIALTLFGVLAIALPDRFDTHVVLTMLVGTAIGAVFELAYFYGGSVSIRPEQITAALQAR